MPARILSYETTKGDGIMTVKDGKQKTEYSQNRLRSKKLVDMLLDKSSIAKGDLVYDIGAGCGIISEELAKRQARVIAIEQDNRLYNKLKQKLVANPLVILRHGDFLAEPLPRRENYKVFANIPFMLTAEIVRRLLFSQNPPDDCYLIMQREAARKFAGLPKETLFSLLLKPWFEFKIRHHFRRADFFPTPAVDTVLLQVEHREQALVTAENAHMYRDLLAYSFNQGKATMKSALKRIFTRNQFTRLSKDLGFRTESGPTTLTFPQWLGIYDYFVREVDDERKVPVTRAEKRLRWQQTNLKKIHRTR
jgi:23S rRNA (adenine-N6)-dimethyltransferase